MESSGPWPVTNIDTPAGDAATRLYIYTSSYRVQDSQLQLSTSYTISL